MSIYEFNEEEVYAMWAEEFYEDGMNAGRADMIQRMLRNGRTPEEIADFCGCSIDEILPVEAQMTEKVTATL